ncbi:MULTISPECIES: DUF6049 family protein [Microbacterium]|uniref:DUF6049 family protein n=1 Tax=Microbacterium TaxID=33882 RepID=UPI00344C483F
MTFISPAPGRRPPRRSLWLRTAAAATAVIALAAPAPAAFAAVDDAPDETVTATLAPGAGGVVPASGDLTLTLTADNPGPDAVPAGAATVGIGSDPLVSTAAIASWLDSGSTGASFDDVGEIAMPEVASEQSASAALTIDAGDAPIDDLDPGVYPVRAVYGTGEDSLRARTVLVVPDTGAPARQIGVVVPITAGPQSTGVLSSDQLSELTAEGGDLREQVDAVTGTPAILAVDPAITASIRALGSAAPADAVAWLDDLIALPNDRFALQYGDADLAAQIGAGEASPLRPVSFAAYLDPTDFGAPAVDGEATPTPTPTPEEPTLPTLEELFDVGADRDSVFWPATGTAGAETVAALGAVTGGDDPPVTLLPSSVVRSDAGAHAVSADTDLLLYDAGLSRLLEDASATDADTARGALLAEFTARVAVGDLADPLLVTVDRSNGRSQAALRGAIDAATGLPGWTATDLDGLLAAPAAAVDVDSVPADQDRVAVIDGFRAAHGGLQRISGVLDDPTLLTSSVRATELQLLGNAWLDDREGWDAAIQAQRERIASWTDGVALVLGGPITLAGASAPLVFTVRNDLPWPARVDLLASPGDARLVIESTTEVEIGAQQTSRVAIPVSALVGSGESSVDLQLRTPSGVEIGRSETVEVSVRAEWESVALVILIVLVSALLVFGVVRTVRRRKRMPVAP